MQVSNILQCSRCTQQSEYINFLQTLLFDYPVGNITTRCVLVYHRIQTRRLIEHVRDVQVDEDTLHVNKSKSSSPQVLNAFPYQPNHQ